MANAIKCNISFEELEKYRDKEGYINLDELNLELTEESREKVGNKDRIKNWVNFLGTEALVRSEFKVDGKRNAGIYAELIVEELAKQAGLSSAFYDLIKINGEYGIVTKKMFNSKECDLLTLDSLIGQTEFYEEYPEMSDYIEVEEKLYKSLKEENIQKDNRKEIIKEFRKRNAFFMMVCSLDKHTENISFISSINKKTNEKQFELAPIYDSESSLMLDMDIETLEKIEKHGLGLQQNVDMLDPKIAVFEGIYSSLWKNTLDTLCEDDDIFRFILDCYDNLNINEAIKNVEKKIKAPLPKIVKSIATYVFEFRRKQIEKIIYPTLQQDDIGKQYSEEISRRCIEEEIRQGEENEILRKIMFIYGVEEKNYER